MSLNSRIAWAVLAFMWGLVFPSNMYVKESSLSNKPGWEEYRKKSWLFLPKPGFLCGDEEDGDRREVGNAGKKGQ